MDFLVYLTLVVGGALLLWYLSYYSSYHIALFLFKKIMPARLEKGDQLWFKIKTAIPFTIGLALDIYFNVVHFSFELHAMNKRSGIKNAKFWPRFSDVKGPKTLYKITLTERLQGVLDTYPTHSQAYKYAVEMKELLNKYDPDHLVITDRKEER